MIWDLLENDGHNVTGRLAREERVRLSSMQPAQ
jgi:hypothetical protein